MKRYYVTRIVHYWWRIECDDGVHQYSHCIGIAKSRALARQWCHYLNIMLLFKNKALRHKAGKE